MKAMILAAGQGIRLLPLTETVPKPMMLIGDKPIIVHQIGWLKSAGIREVVINVHHLPDQITNFLGDGSQLGVDLVFSREEELLDTGGGIAKALSQLDDNPFLLLNGDVWTDFPFQRLIAFQTRYAHLILEPATTTSRDFGLVRDCVTRHIVDQNNDHTFCGISVIHPQIFASKPVEPFSLTVDLLFDLVAQGKVTGESYTGTRIDIGTFEGLRLANELQSKSLATQTTET